MMTNDSSLLKVYVFGSTEGESIVLRLPGGKWGVVDSFASSLGDPTTNPAFELLKREGALEIEFLCLTHPHDDHYRGMGQLLREFVVRQFWAFIGPDPQDISLLKSYFRAEAEQADRAGFKESAAELASIFDLVDQRASIVSPRSPAARCTRCRGTAHRGSRSRRSPPRMIGWASTKSR